MSKPQATTAPARVTILGLCPKCDGWFSCDDAFNPTVPMPCCPHCHLAPVTMDYRFPPAVDGVAGDAVMDAELADAADAEAPVDHLTTRLAGAMAAAAGPKGAQPQGAVAGPAAVGRAHEVVDRPALEAKIPGVDLGVATRPAGPALGVNTYGAFPSTEGEWTVMVADVAGHGHDPDAVAQTAMVRTSAHGLAKAVRSPGLMLGLLNQLLIDEPSAERLCSAVMVRLHTPAGDETSLRATVARAGHPYPLVRKADGRVQAIRPEGMLLGVATTMSLDTETVTLEPGDALILYTDGLLRGWNRDPSAGIVDLVTQLTDSPGESADRMARQLLGDGDMARGPQPDDGTVLVVKAHPAPAAVASAPTARTVVGEGSATAVIEHPGTTTATVVTVAGTLDADPMTRLVDMLAAQYAHRDVVVDLSGVMMTSPSGIRSLVARLSAWSGTATLRIVCDRLTGRRLLRRWGMSGLPLDRTVAAALDSLSDRTVSGAVR